MDTAQIDFPPGVCFGGSVRDRSLRVVAVGLAIDRQSRHTSKDSRACRCSSIERDILPPRSDLHLRQRQNAFHAG